jgi:hypothetical protein
MVSEPMERADLTLLERCGQLERELHEYRTLRALTDQAKGFIARRKNLTEAKDALAPLMETLALFRGAQIGTELPTALATRLRDSLARLRAAYEVSTGPVMEPSEAKARFSRELPLLSEKLRESLSWAWGDYGDRQAVPVDEAVLSVLVAIPEFRPTIERVRKLSQQVEQRRRRLPRSQQDLDAFREAVDQLRQEWRSLSADSVPPEVLQFLRAAASGGTPIADYTETVRDWLAAQQILGRFHVVIR